MDTDVFCVILAFTDLQTLLLSCRPASHTSRTLVDAEVKCRMQRIFAWFSNDVAAMRNCMRTNGVFIGGSLPLTLFSPVHFPPSNANLYVPASGRDAVVQHLCLSEGYEVLSEAVITPAVTIPTDPVRDETVYAYGAGLNSVTTLRRENTYVLIVTYADPNPPSHSTDVLTVSWTTALFNFVTADFAVCAYPALTLQGRGLWHMNRFYKGMPGTGSDHALNAYCARGFEFSRHPNWWFRRMDMPCPRGWTCPFTRRRFGDGGCLFLGSGLGRTPAAFGREWIFGGVDVEEVHDV